MLLLVASALATPPGPMASGWVVSTRDDAPTDARIPFGANYALDAVVTSGPGAGEALEVEMLVAYSMGNEPVVAVLPPAAGWAPGEAYTVEAVHLGYGTGLPTTFPLSFTVGTRPAADPVAPEVLEVEVGPWSEEQTYLWGCCEPVRTVSVRMINHDEDPWSYVELRGVFQGPSQLTTVPVLSHLGLGLGPGAHTISFDQWDQDGELHPLCFAVVGVAADGEESAETPICVERGGGVSVDGEQEGGLGCATTPSGGWLGLGLVLLLRRRRR